PRRPLPRGVGRTRGGVLHSGRVEGRAPASVVVLGQLEVEALAVHPHGDVADAGPGVEPGAERPQRSVVRAHRAPGEAERRKEESATLVEHVTGSPDPLVPGKTAGPSSQWTSRSSD